LHWDITPLSSRKEVVDKISKDLTLHLDMTYVVFLSPHFTFDGYSKVRAVGVSDFDPKMFRASIGLTYYLLTR
jgi:hypothetical protein